MRARTAFAGWIAFVAALVAMPVAADRGVAVEIARLDASAEAAIEDVRGAPESRWVQADAMRRQATASWWRLRVPESSRGTAHTDWVLAIREVFDGELVAYAPPDYRAEPLGTFDRERRQVGSRHRLAITVPAADAEAPVYVHVVRARGQPMRVAASPLADYIDEDAARVRLTSMILSALLLLAIVSVLYAVALRRWMLLLFCFWILSATIYVLVMSGEITWFVSHAGVLRHAMTISGVAVDLGVLAVYAFVIEFLGVPRHYPRLAWVMRGLLALAGVSLVALFALPGSPLASQLINIATVSLSACSLGAAVMRARAGSPQGWFFLLGWGILTVMGTWRAWRFLTYQGTPAWLEIAHPAAYVFGALVVVVATARAARYAEREMHAARVVARTDPLTRLPNRSQLDDGLDARIDDARERGQPLAVMFIDLDRFKAINDALGHAIGDRCLEAVARVLRRHVRAEDLLVRYGGEEFVLVLQGAGIERARTVAETLRRAVAEECIEVEGRRIVLTASFGVSDLRAGDSAADVLSRADAALYRAKHEGRDRVVSDAAAPAVA